MDIIIKDVTEKQAYAIQTLMPEKIISEINEGIISIKSYIKLDKPKYGEQYYFLDIISNHSVNEKKSIEINNAIWKNNTFDNESYSNKNVFLSYDLAIQAKNFIFMFLEKMK